MPVSAAEPFPISSLSPSETVTASVQATWSPEGGWDIKINPPKLPGQEEFSFREFSRFERAFELAVKQYYRDSRIRSRAPASPKGELTHV